MGDGRPDELRYTAFLSYSHKDAAAAGRLHRRLETYRMPRRLVGTETARGRVPPRLWPIFRDREELPAATDLSETVRAALAQSGALIILCSPAAAGSLWVAEEIETFRALHPDRPILAAVLDGDPPDCFPAALRAFGRDGTWHEPLATDLRKHRDGGRLGLLKLVAGITGVGLDALVQRDAARRIRRVMAVTGAALVAMLGMAALALVAINARAEAERQQAEAERQRAAAEGQIEFMLTDLRARLRGSVGQLDVMAAVNQRALSYYDGQDMAGLSADSLERRARILQAMGEDYIQRGNLSAAMAAFQQAHRTTAEQLERAPAEARRIFAHGQSEYWVGRVYELRRDWPNAARQYALYQVAAERLIGIDPNNPDYMLEMAWGASNRGVIQRDGQGNAAAAQASFEAAVAWFERAIRRRPRDADRRDLANAYGNLADAFYVRELWRQSLAARLQEYRIHETLQRARPADVESTYRLAIVERSIARLSYRIGEPARIRPFLARAYQRSLGLTARDPRNSDWLLLRAKIQCDFLDQTPAGERNMSDRQLRQGIREAAAALQAQRNPRLSEIRICIERELGNTR